MRRQSANLNPLRQLDLETVQPLIDVAQWSTFEEVKRDAAAALATLCRDAKNLEALNDSGIVGALLALVKKIHEPKHRTDVRVVRDAAFCLSRITTNEDARSKVLTAPRGIETVLHIARIVDPKCKLYAAQTILRLSSELPSCVEIIRNNGVECLMQLMDSQATRRLAAAAFKKLANLFASHSYHLDNKVFNQVLGHVMHVKGNMDEIFLKTMLEILWVLSESRPFAVRLIEFQAVSSVLFFLDLHQVAPAVALVALRLLRRLAITNHAALVSAGILPAVKRLCYIHLHDSQVTGSQKDSTSKTPLRLLPLTKVAGTVYTDILVMCLKVLRILASQPENRKVISASGIVDFIVEHQLCISRFRSVRQKSSVIIAQITGEYSGAEREIHQGILAMLNDMMNCKDHEVRLSGVICLSNVSNHESVCRKLCTKSTLNVLVDESLHPKDEVRARIAKIVAHFAKLSENTACIVESKIVLSLLRDIRTGKACSSPAIAATEAISILASHTSLKQYLLTCGALHVLQKSPCFNDVGIREETPASVAILQHRRLSLSYLSQDAAVVRIQAAIRGWLIRKNTRDVCIDLKRLRRMARQSQPDRKISRNFVSDEVIRGFFLTGR